MGLVSPKCHSFNRGEINNYFPLKITQNKDYKVYQKITSTSHT